MKFELTPEDLAVISEALGNAPFKLVAPVIQRLQQQINAQNNPPQTNVQPNKPHVVKE